MVHQNDIIHHPPFMSTLTTPSQTIGGNINHLSRRIIKKSVNINSMFRETQAPTLWPQYKCLYESKWSSSNFNIRLPTVLDNVTSMTLNSIEIPNTHYTFSSELKTNVFTIIEITDSSNSSEKCCISMPKPSNNLPEKNGCCDPCCNKPSTTTYTDEDGDYLCYTPHIIEILPGNYHSDQLIAQIQDSIDATIGPDKVFINMNPVYGRTYIFADPDSNFKFDLDFRLPHDPERDIRMNMGWILGYRKPYYHRDKSWVDGCWYGPDYIPNDSTNNILGPLQNASSFVNQHYNNANSCTNSIIVAPSAIPDEYPIFPQGFVSEGFMDTGGARYLFLIVDDFNNNVNDQYMSLISKNTQLPSSNILARISIPQSKNEIGFENLSDFVPKKREYFGPVNIEKLHFKLVDEYGRIINLNNNEISLLLDFEVIYNL